jgi:hypothetical protein
LHRYERLLWFQVSDNIVKQKVRQWIAVLNAAQRTMLTANLKVHLPFDTMCSGTDEVAFTLQDCSPMSCIVAPVVARVLLAPHVQHVAFHFHHCVSGAVGLLVVRATKHCGMVGVCSEM